MTRILAFDIGIKNLAWAVAHKENGIVYVDGWANENLISGGTADSDKLKNTCKSCTKGKGHKAVYGEFCVRHCPATTPALRDLSGNLLKKIPSLTVLKGIAASRGADKAALKNKESVLAFLREKYLFPKVVESVKKVDLEEIHDGMRAFVAANEKLFSTCSQALLENQPVLKNPVMKSVQMMLFATLRDLLEPRPKVRLVHASKKTTGVDTAKGDEGYSDRKAASEGRIQSGLEKKTIVMACGDGRDAAWFSKQTKKSDLADCLSMVMDCLSAVPGAVPGAVPANA
jgi:hypothetical protein